MPRRLFPARCLALLAVPLALVAGLLPGQAARAADSSAQTLAQNQPAPDIGGFSPSQLESYASAVVKVQQIDRAWSPRIEQAQNEEEAKVLTTQATDEMVGEIQAEGLSVQEYNAITQAAENDDHLYDHIMTLLAQR
jgi:Domain of unknown function (DUF4168)